MLRRSLFALILSATAMCAAQAPATPATPPAPAASPFHMIPLPAQPAITPGQITLLSLESRFAESVASGGGKAFASWFADDAVTLSNGKPAVRGRGAIAAQANWDPKDYTLTWTAEGAEMGPSNDMGYTWGRYEGRTKDKSGHDLVTTGRYITIWKKQSDGAWKVMLDASADGPPRT